MCLWELIGRGMTPRMRGLTLGWTFGIGFLAVVALLLVISWPIAEAVVVQLSTTTLSWNSA